MEQYSAIKAKHAGDILLFRLGDFYEMFFEDAEIGSRLLGLTLTKRQETPMAGLPHHAADNYITKVLEAQAKDWGAPLLNHLVYARRPSIFKGARAMWTGLDASGLINPALRAIVNRRVAFLNGCEF